MHLNIRLLGRNLKLSNPEPRYESTLPFVYTIGPSNGFLTSCSITTLPGSRTHEIWLLQNKTRKTDTSTEFSILKMARTPTQSASHAKVNVHRVHRFQKLTTVLSREKSFIRTHFSSYTEKQFRPGRCSSVRPTQSEEASWRTTRTAP